MKRFLKPLHHSLVFWYGVISLAFCLIWGNHLLHMESYNNAGGWMVWGLCLLFGGCMLVCVVVLNGVELTDEFFIIRHGLSLRPTIRIAYHKIAYIELYGQAAAQGDFARRGDYPHAETFAPQFIFQPEHLLPRTKRCNSIYITHNCSLLQHFLRSCSEFHGCASIILYAAAAMQVKEDLNADLF